MKKFLSLVLALVMTMSLVTISAGAKDFDDNGDIDYKEAVDVISALGIVDGYSDGSFRPDGSLTRGAAAKIICNLILGPTTASALSATTAPFKDVPTTNVFAGYITYCAQQGIFGGYGDGTFRPSGTLTGNAFMKMLLGALGYDSSVEGYTGSNWQVSVIKQASGIGLDDGNDEFVGSKAVTRQEAALYALNMLKATMVEYDTKSTVVVGDVQISTSSTRTDVSNENGRTDGNIKPDKKMQFAEKYFTNLKVDSTGEDDFGRPANVWTYKSDEIGTYANKDQLVATYTAKVTKSDVYNDVGRSVYDDLTDGKSDLTVWFDGVDTAVKTADVDKYVERNNSGRVNNTANGDLTEIYVDDDTNDVTIVTVRTYVFQAASDYDSRKETVSLTTDSSKYDTNITLDSRTLDVDDFANITDLKADDYVLVTAVNNNGRYEVKSVDKAEVVSGNVTGYKEGSNVTMGGTQYSYSATADTIKKTSYNVGREASLVLDSYGYVIAVEESVVLSDYVYIAEFGKTNNMSSTSRAVAYAIFPDGTDAEIVVDKAYDKYDDPVVPGDDRGQVSNKNDISSWTNNANQIGWFTYSVNSSDEYTLYPIESKYVELHATDSTTGTPITTNSDVTPFVSASGLTSVRADDNTVAVVMDSDGDVSVFTGVKNFPAITMSSGNAKIAVVTKGTADYAALVYIELSGNATISGESETNLVYVLSYDGRYVTTDNETYYQYTVLNGDQEEDVVADAPIQSQTGDVYQVANYLTRNADDQLTDFNLVDGVSDGANVIGNATGITSTTPNMAITQSSGTLSIADNNYLVNSDTAITLVTLGNLGGGIDASIMNKDEDADYEVAANISAKELVDALKGYNYTYEFGGKTTDNGRVLEELYVTVTNASVANNDVAELSEVTYGGDEISFYTSESAAKAAPFVVAAPNTNLNKVFTFTAVGNVTTEISKNGADYVPLSSDKWDGSWTTGTTENSYDVIKITVKSLDGSQSETYYIAYQVATTYKLTIVNQDTTSNVKVTYDGNDYIVDKKSGVTDTSEDIATGLTQGQVITISYKAETSKKIGSVTVRGTGVTSSEFDGEISIKVGTGDVTVTIADAAD